MVKEHLLKLNFMKIKSWGAYGTEMGLLIAYNAFKKCTGSDLGASTPGEDPKHLSTFTKCVG